MVYNMTAHYARSTVILLTGGLEYKQEKGEELQAKYFLKKYASTTIELA